MAEIPIVNILSTTTVAEAARTMRERGINYLVVLADGAPVGLITDHTLGVVAAAADAAPDDPVAKFMMTRQPRSWRAADRLTSCGEDRRQE